MNTSPVTANKNLVMLAQMLERLDRSAVPVDPEQYRTLVGRVSAELEAAPLDAVLDAFPATAQLYENLNYQHAGLCRSPLERALGAELAARAAIDGARRMAPGETSRQA